MNAKLEVSFFSSYFVFFFYFYSFSCSNIVYRESSQSRIISNSSSHLFLSPCELILLKIISFLIRKWLKAFHYYCYCYFLLIFSFFFFLRFLFYFLFFLIIINIWLNARWTEHGQVSSSPYSYETVKWKYNCLRSCLYINSFLLMLKICLYVCIDFYDDARCSSTSTKVIKNLKWDFCVHNLWKKAKRYFLTEKIYNIFFLVTTQHSTNLRFKRFNLIDFCH